MTDKFLNAGGIAGNISNGTVSIYGSKIGAKNLDPSRAVKTDSQGRLQTTDLDIDDINNLQSILDNTLSNPFTPLPGQQFVVNGEIKCSDLETDDFFSLNDEISRIEYIDKSFGLTTIASNILTDDVACSSILNQISSTRIDMTSNTDINFQATNVTVNSNDILTNPLTAVLDCDSNNIVNMGQFNINMNSFVINTEGQISDLQGDIGTLQSKTQLLTSNATISTFSESLRVRESLAVAKAQPTLDSGNCSALFILDGGSGLFSIQKVNGSNIDELFKINTVAKIDMLTSLDMNSNNIDNVNIAVITTASCLNLSASDFICPTINNITAAGGVYMMTGNANVITATTVETSLLIGSTGIGSLTVNAFEFDVSSYHFNLSGNISTTNNNAVTIKLKSGSIILAQFPFLLTATSNEYFEVEADFSIMVRGAAGEAKLSTNFDFTYSDSGATNWRGKRICFVNNTTFDTEISNTLDITVQWSSTSATNSIQCQQAILTRTY